MYKFKFRQSRLHKGKGTKLHYTPQLYAVTLIFLSILQQIYWEVMKLLVLLKSPFWSVRRTQKSPFAKDKNLPKILIIALYTDLRVPCNSKIPPFSG